MAELLNDQDVYRQIEATLEARREKARRDLNARRSAAFEKIPELENIEYEIAETGVALNRAMLSGELTPAEARRKIEVNINALQDRRECLLRANGFPDNYLTLAPECAICGDTGHAAGAGGVPERCACFRQLLFNKLETASNILSAGAAGFELFDETLYSDLADESKYKQAVSPRANIRRIKDSALKFVRSFGEGVHENLYFFGSTGTGKTFMAASIANELMRGGMAVLYLSAQSLFDIILEYRMKSYKDADYSDSLYRQIYTCELLIIDDLGAGIMNDLRYTELLTLLNERLKPSNTPETASGDSRKAVNGYNPIMRTAKSTIISTNLSLKKLLSKYDERMLSRIVGSFRIVYFYGDDIRQKRRGVS